MPKVCCAIAGAYAKVKILKEGARWIFLPLDIETFKRKDVLLIFILLGPCRKRATAGKSQKKQAGSFKSHCIRVSASGYNVFKLLKLGK